MTAFFLDDTGRLRTFWRFVIFGAAMIVVQVAIGIVIAIGLLVYLLASGRSPHVFDMGSLEQYQLPIQIAAAVPVTLATAGIVLSCRRFLDRRSIQSLGFVRPGRTSTSSVAGGFAIGSVPVIVVIGVLVANGSVAWTGVSASLETALLFPTLMLMAFNEEIVCRGYLLQNLLDIRRPVFGILASSVIFWLAHALNPSAWSSPVVGLNLFGAGVTLALAYRAAGNIWFPTAMHFGWNFAQALLFQLPVSGIATDGLLDVVAVASAPTWLTGGAFGIEGSILATAAEICMSAGLATVLIIRHAANNGTFSNC